MTEEEAEVEKNLLLAVEDMPSPALLRGSDHRVNRLMYTAYTYDISSTCPGSRVFVLVTGALGKLYAALVG